MSNGEVDPSGNTEQFKAFAQAPAEAERSARGPLIAGALIVAVLVVLVAVLVLT